MEAVHRSHARAANSEWSMRASGSRSCRLKRPSRGGTAGAFSGSASFSRRLRRGKSILYLFRHPGRPRRQPGENRDRSPLCATRRGAARSGIVLLLYSLREIIPAQNALIIGRFRGGEQPTLLATLILGKRGAP